MSKREAAKSPVRRGAERSRRIAACVWWALLPYAGGHGYGRDDIPPENWRWWMRFDAIPYWLWKLVGKLPSSAPFLPMEPIICTCDECLANPEGFYTSDPQGSLPKSSDVVAVPQKGKQ